jgi:hypothetical protein
MKTILDATYQSSKKTIGQILISWLGTSLIIFIIYERFDQMYNFSTWYWRLAMTLLISGLVPLILFYWRLTEKPRK